MTQSVLFTAAFPASAFFPGHKHFSSTISIQTKSKDSQGGAIAPKTPNDWTTMIRHSHLPP